MNASASTIVPATVLTTRYWREGYRPGAPVNQLDAVVLADTAAWSRGTCGHCGHRGLSFQPWHRGESYRGMAVCKHCCHAEEV